jgi:hypothetical protein
MVDSFFGHGGIITTDGDAHRRARKLLQGPFKPSHIHQMLPVMLEEIRACIGEWPLGKPFILDSKFNELSLRIFARVILGARTPEEVRKCVKLGMMVKKYLGLSFLDFISPKPIAKRTPHYVYYSFMITRALQELIRNREEDLCRDSGSSYIPDVLTNLIRVRDKTATLNLDSYKFKFAGESIYHFIWDELANNYLEKIKDRKDIESILTLDHAFRDSLKLISPFMPFITEAVWQELYKDSDQETIILSTWPIA